MLDKPVVPILPIEGIRPLQPVSLPRHPSYSQLQKWLSFSRRLRARKARGNADKRSPTTEAKAAADFEPSAPNHIDEYI